MQALKQAAREGEQPSLDALCEEWSVSAAAPVEAPQAASSQAPRSEPSEVPRTAANH